MFRSDQIERGSNNFVANISSLSCGYLFRDNSDFVSKILKAVFSVICFVVIVNFKPGEYMRKVFFSVSCDTDSLEEKIRVLPIESNL